MWKLRAENNIWSMNAAKYDLALLLLSKSLHVPKFFFYLSFSIESFLFLLVLVVSGGVPFLCCVDFSFLSFFASLPHQRLSIRLSRSSWELQKPQQALVNEASKREDKVKKKWRKGRILKECVREWERGENRKFQRSLRLHLKRQGKTNHPGDPTFGTVVGKRRRKPMEWTRWTIGTGTTSRIAVLRDTTESI